MELEFHQLERRYEALRVLSPPRERRLLASLEERGQQQPIIVVRHGEAPDRYVVVDGYSAFPTQDPGTFDLTVTP